MTTLLVIPGSIRSYVRRAFRSRLGLEAQHFATVTTEMRDLTEEQFEAVLEPFKQALRLFECVGFPTRLPEEDIELDLGGDAQLAFEALQCLHRSECDQLHESGAVRSPSRQLQELGELVANVEHIMETQGDSFCQHPGPGDSRHQPE